MKKLFYLFLCLSLVFAACEPEPTPEPEPNKTTVLKLASDDTLDFTAEGGVGVIKYELAEETRTEPVAVQATCAAEWVSNIAVADDILFTVAANEGEARDTKVVVSYGSQSFEVVVNQAAATEAPAPTDEVVFEAQMLVGEYYADYYTPDAGNYYIFFTDYGFDEGGYVLANSTYYQLDLYGDFYEGEPNGDFVPLPAGTYTLDVNESMAKGTIGYSYSAYMRTNDSGYEVVAYFDAAELVVNEDGSCVLNAVVGGVKHTVTFSGEAQINDRREVSSGGEDKELEASYAYAYYYGDQYNPGVADNFYFFLSDMGLDADGWELPNATYYRFDLYSEVVDAENGLALPYGTYTIDNGSCDPYTIGSMYSAYYVMDAEGWDYVESAAPTSGTVVVDESGVTAHIMVNGAWHTVTYSGDITIYDSSQGGEGGDDEYEGPYSTLWEDYRCNFDNHTLYYQYYGDYYETGYMNWTFAIMPNGGEGDFVQFDVVASSNSTTDFFGEYTISNSYNAYTAYPGYIDYWDGYMAGSWYYTEDGWTMAPFIDGTMSVVDNGDGTVTVEFDVYDDYYNNITGSWTGQMFSADQMATRAASFKKSDVKRVDAPVKSVVMRSAISKF